MSDKLDLLKEEATDLGIKFNPNIGEDKLQAKIDAHYEAQESSGDELQEAEQSEEKVAVASKATPAKKKTMAEIAKELYEKAKKPVVVTIIDNDQRVNNQTTTCKATWANSYYDMGTKIFPLNTPIEIPQGFVNVLKEVKIPHHTKDPKTNLSRTTMRDRFTISYEDKK